LTSSRAPTCRRALSLDSPWSRSRSSTCARPAHGSRRRTSSVQPCQQSPCWITASDRTRTLQNQMKPLTIAYRREGPGRFALLPSGAERSRDLSRASFGFSILEC
jgi:hypothetical protein